MSFHILGVAKQGGHEYDICRKTKIHPQAGRNVAGTVSGKALRVQTGNYKMGNGRRHP